MTVGECRISVGVPDASSVILAGELTLVLEDGSESALRAGDVIVQNGVVHGWRNATSTIAVAAFVLVGYRS
jgi:quercetin dioxygenase-like cupin family protein